jgi:hypothetical protein
MPTVVYPTPGTVELADLRDEALPALRGVASILEDLSVTVARRGDEGHAAALRVLAGQLETCRDLVDRATCSR